MVEKIRQIQGHDAQRESERSSAFLAKASYGTKKKTAKQ